MQIGQVFFLLHRVVYNITMAEPIKKSVSKKQQEILDAALKVFSEKGYELSSMDEIAHVANVSKRTIYNHFHSKDDLLMTVASNFIAMSDELKNIEYNPKMELRDQLGLFIESEIKILRNSLWLNFIKTIFDVANRRPVLLKRMSDSTCKRDEIFMSWLKAAENDGKIKVQDPSLSAELFWNTINGNFTFTAMGMGSFDQTRSARMKSEIIALFLSRYAL